MRVPHRARTLIVAVAATTLLAVGCSGPRPSSEPLAERVGTVVDRQLAVDPVFERVRAVVVSRDGETVYETYQDSSPEDHHVVFSVTKSVVSTLIGIAIDERLIGGVDATLADLLPTYADQMGRQVATTTLEHLLTMTGGLTAPEDADSIEFMLSRDPVAEALTHPFEPPGVEFVYSNEASHLLAAILVEATGMRVLDYARQELFDPIGIPTEPADEPVATVNEQKIDKYWRADTFGWPIDRQQVHLGWGMVKLRTTDMTRFGQLFLDDGVWDDEQVVPAGWVVDATVAQVPTGVDPDAIGPDGYGYQWWVGETRGHRTYSAQGFGGQLIQVVPDLGLVIVVVTEVDPTVPSDRGISGNALAYIVDLIVEQVDS